MIQTANNTLGNKCSVGSNPTLSNQGDGANALTNQEDAPITCSVYTAAAAFGEILGLFGQTSGSIRDFLCFTILMVTENETHFMVDYCGDGFIVKERLDGTIEFEELSDGEYPKYFAYNYVDKDMLKQYKDGVIFSTKAFPKDEYRNIGVASDGIRFAMKDAQFKKEFTEALQSGKEVRVKRFINKHQRVFQDDTTIVL